MALERAAPVQEMSLAGHSVLSFQSQGNFSYYHVDRSKDGQAPGGQSLELPTETRSSKFYRALTCGIFPAFHDPSHTYSRRPHTCTNKVSTGTPKSQGPVGIRPRAMVQVNAHKVGEELCRLCTHPVS